ncbi:4Fe-4S dicluster domain-containing protein [Chloroflexota bacterium]
MCELSCSLAKEGAINPYLARIQVIKVDDYSFAPVICRRCNPPKCLQACPIPDEAMSWDEALGVVVINESGCIHCFACIEACPFGAIRVGPNNEVLKCDLCGGDPVCVKYCPERPENSLPHLPWPKQSCLKYIEPHRVNDHKFASERAKSQEIRLPKDHLQKRFELQPHLAKERSKYEKD